MKYRATVKLCKKKNVLIDLKDAFFYLRKI